jgi:hypothetical protein
MDNICKLKKINNSGRKGFAPAAQVFLSVVFLGGNQ